MVTDLKNICILLFIVKMHDFVLVLNTKHLEWAVFFQITFISFETVLLRGSPAEEKYN